MAISTPSSGGRRSPSTRGDAEKRHRKDMADSMPPSIFGTPVRKSRQANTTTANKAQKRQIPLFTLFPPRSQPASVTSLPKELRDMIWKEAFAPYALPQNNSSVQVADPQSNSSNNNSSRVAYGETATLYTCQPPPLAHICHVCHVCHDARAHTDMVARKTKKKSSNRYRWEQQATLPIITTATNPAKLLHALQHHARIILDLRTGIHVQPWESLAQFLTILATAASDHQVLLAVPLHGKTSFYTTPDLAMTRRGAKWVTPTSDTNTLDRYVRVDDTQACAELRALVWDARGRRHLGRLVRGVLGGPRGRAAVVAETVEPFAVGLETVNALRAVRREDGRRRLVLPAMEVVMQVRMACCDDFTYLSTTRSEGCPCLDRC
ncbi:hypothetical protein B0T22DRAFT_535435 [Podospora appendiculata]|uniref:2EXR domain-containing protein n=1 Tax=Podospora appendiculata TaxID=314037 RepID=A0AAE0X8U0_9PEZI|nr:hypothetical protein B0T22DRAFT_535435 [Podospora appendiculata]